MLTNILSISLGAILINNFIFSQFLGCCPFLGCSNKMDTAVGMLITALTVVGELGRMNTRKLISIMSTKSRLQSFGRLLSIFLYSFRRRQGAKKRAGPNKSGLTRRNATRSVYLFTQIFYIFCEKCQGEIYTGSEGMV